MGDGDERVGEHEWSAPELSAVHVPGDDPGRGQRFTRVGHGEQHDGVTRPADDASSAAVVLRALDRER